MRICPKDMKPCIDDLCRGSGVCLRTGEDMLDTCWRCGQVYSDEYAIECGCEPDEPDYYEDDPAPAPEGGPAPTADGGREADRG